jgi:hypothetical protein
MKCPRVPRSSFVTGCGPPPPLFHPSRAVYKPNSHGHGPGPKKKRSPGAPVRFARNHDGPQANDSGHAACHCVARTLLSVLGMTHSLNPFRENRAAALTQHTVTSWAKPPAPCHGVRPNTVPVSEKSDAKITPFYFKTPVYGTPPPPTSRVI